MTLTKEEKQELKAHRVEKILAKTARDMILSDGVEAVSVRKVANQAGYAMGTIYNHFKNLDALLWHTRELMIEDIVIHFTNLNLPVNSVDDIKNIFKTYMTYFIDLPNVYKFFYFHHLDKDANTLTTNMMDRPEIREQFGRTFAFLLRSGQYSADEIAHISTSIIYGIQGMLTLYISNNDDLTLDAMYSHLDNMMNLLLSK